MTRRRIRALGLLLVAPFFGLLLAWLLTHMIALLFGGDPSSLNAVIPAFFLAGITTVMLVVLVVEP